jgi:hypothetical protein
MLSIYGVVLYCTNMQEWPLISGYTNDSANFFQVRRLQ